VYSPVCKGGTARERAEMQCGCRSLPPYRGPPIAARRFQHPTASALACAWLANAATRRWAPADSHPPPRGGSTVGLSAGGVITMSPIPQASEPTPPPCLTAPASRGLIALSPCSHSHARARRSSFVSRPPLDHFHSQSPCRRGVPSDAFVSLLAIVSAASPCPRLGRITPRCVRPLAIGPLLGQAASGPPSSRAYVSALHLHTLSSEPATEAVGTATGTATGWAVGRA
jgi:hypothetical protein